jgi:hypothetical protein
MGYRQNSVWRAIKRRGVFPFISRRRYQISVINADIKLSYRPRYKQWLG